MRATVLKGIMGGVEFTVLCSAEKFERMAREAIEVCLRTAKRKQQWKIRQLQCQEQGVGHIPYYLSGLSRALFFGQPFSGKL